MKPAFSVLFFTVSSGAGYGLAMWTLYLQLFGDAVWNLKQLFIIGLVALCLITLGLLSSTLHLANPKNAWRSFSRFRTSWLSREGVFAVLFYPVIIAYALVLWRSKGQLDTLVITLGTISIVLAFIIVICTGMIYASLKPIRQWHNPLTVPIYIAFSLMSGSLLLATIDIAFLGNQSKLLLICFVASLFVTAILKLCYFAMIGKPDGSTINTATGFSQAQVRLLDAGHNADTFLTKEFVFDAGALKLLRLRMVMFALVFVLPAIIISTALLVSLPSIIFMAFISLISGLVIERWLFFAEARHVVRLYHGDQQT